MIGLIVGDLSKLSLFNFSKRSYFAAALLNVGSTFTHHSLCLFKFTSTFLNLLSLLPLFLVSFFISFYFKVLTQASRCCHVTSTYKTHTHTHIHTHPQRMCVDGTKVVGDKISILYITVKTSFTGGNK